MADDMRFGVYHLFCGIGGGALGFAAAREEWLGIRGRFVTIGGVDSDPDACADFEALTGVRPACMDLFSREDYIAFHGCEPPSGWREASPKDIRAAAGHVRPDVVFSSPPCKGLSRLLPSAAASSPKYAALNRLTLRGISLVLDAWADDPPDLVILENVPGITSRGADLLGAILRLLRERGYAVHTGTHDLGAVGGLSQHRRRFILVARRPDRAHCWLYRPPLRPVRAVGDTLSRLPMPDDPSAGPMHRLPRLQWRTWVRLALIPAGGDWRDLQGTDAGQYRIVPASPKFAHIYRTTPWSEPFLVVTSSRDQAIADPRIGHSPRNGVFRVASWDGPSSTVVGAASVRGSNGVAAVADPRVPAHGRSFKGSPGLMGVIGWESAAPAVTGSASVSGSNMAAAVADPRLGCAPRSGAYRVLRWDESAGTVTASGDVHSQGAAAVADPRVPGDGDAGVWVIVAEDGTWHRPLTTLELSALQGFPVRMPDGSPLVLSGRSHARWRERIGNAVPPPAAQAIAQSMLLTLIASRANGWLMAVMATSVWVRTARSARRRRRVRRTM